MSYAGKILRINLTTGEIRKEDLPENLARKFIGGRGLASKILFDELDPKVDPLSPDSVHLMIISSNLMFLLYHNR